MVVIPLPVRVGDLDLNLGQIRRRFYYAFYFHFTPTKFNIAFRGSFVVVVVTCTQRSAYSTDSITKLSILNSMMIQLVVNREYYE